MANRTRGKARKHVDDWARLDANNKREMTTITTNGRQYVDTLWMKAKPAQQEYDEAGRYVE